MNAFEKEKKEKIVSLFFRQSQDQRKKKKTFSCESAADPASSGKGSFHNQDEWLREEHERKSDTSEKQWVETSSLEPF